MNTSNLEKAIAEYETAINCLTNPSETTTETTEETALSESSSPQQTSRETKVLKLLNARDRIQVALTQVPSISNDNLTKIQTLDNTLQTPEYKNAIAPILTTLRPTFNPDTTAWWWFLESVQPESNWNWFFKIASITNITVALALVGEISFRFLSGGPDIFSAILVSVQGVLSLLTVNSVIADARKEGGRLLRKKINKPNYPWQAIGTGSSVLLLLGVLLFRLSLPNIATCYVNWGWEHYDRGDFGSAEENYQRALSLNPDNTLANFRLGLLYEDLQQFKLAEKQYLLAMQGGNQTAINNLARLYILNKNNAAAVSLINIARARFAKQNLTFTPDTEYALLKNLGWARFNQEAYDEAKFYLDQAFNLLPKTSSDNQNRADIYCLLAQVQEKQEEDAKENWNQCNSKANPIYPEEDQWRRLAQQRIKKMLTEKSS